MRQSFFLDFDSTFSKSALATNGHVGDAIGDEILESEVIDMSTVFYDQHSSFDLFRVFVKRQKQDYASISDLTEMMEIHPLSLGMLIQENGARYSKTQNLGDEMNHLADMSELVSFIDPIFSTIFNDVSTTLKDLTKEIPITLMNWGVMTMYPLLEGEKGQKNQKGQKEKVDIPVEKSQYFGFKLKEDHRSSLISR